jgi:hypothetical protein
MPRSWNFNLRLAPSVLLPCITILFAGCTGRGITISSVPEGAEVSIDRRVIGRTPVRVGVTHYGDYRIELRKTAEGGEGEEEATYYKPLVRVEKFRPAWYGWDPVSFVADNVIPARVQDELYVHYILEPLPNPEEETRKRLSAKTAAEAEDDVEDDTAIPVEIPLEELAKLTYRPLLDRALAARRGKVTHPITGKDVTVKIGSNDLKNITLPGEAQAIEQEASAPTEQPETDQEPPRPPDKKRKPSAHTEPARKAPPERLPFAPAGDSEKR